MHNNTSLRTLILAAMLITAKMLFSQIIFQKTFGGIDDEWGCRARLTSDGGYIIAGTTASYGAGGADFYLIRLNASGDTLWTRTYGSPYDDEFSDMVPTADGGFILTGAYDLDYSSNYAGAYVVRVDAIGDTVWTRTYSADSIDYPEAIIQTMSQNYLITGTTNSFANDEDIFLISIDQYGDTIWESEYYTYYNEGAASVMQTLDSGFVLTGYIDDTVNYNAGNIILMKTDLWGDTIGTVIYSSILDEQANAVIQLPDSGFVIAGYGDGFGGGKDVLLIRTNKYGDIIWTKAYGGPADDEAYDIKQTSDYGFIIVGTTQSYGAGGSDVYLIRTDSTDDTLWTRAFGGTSIDEGVSVAQTPDGGFIIGANTVSFGAGLEDLYIIKTDANGNAGCNQTNTATNIITAPVYADYESPDYDFGFDTWTDTTFDDNPGAVTSTLCFSCASPVPICMVTVDNTSTKNVIVWEKPTTASIDSFRIYREVINNYIHIGSVPYDSLSIFIDTTNGINPNTTSYRYKISVVDTCGQESDTSAYHETIHVMTNYDNINGKVDLLWDAYEGFTFTFYRILRDSAGNGNYVKIDSVPNSNFTYTDLNPPLSSNFTYRVEVIPPSICVATRSVDYHSSRSNEPPAINTGIADIHTNDISVSVYPNPNSGDFTLNFDGFDQENAHVTIFNIHGQKVYENQTSLLKTKSQHFRLKGLHSGLYYIQVSSDDYIRTIKFTVQPKI